MVMRKRQVVLGDTPSGADEQQLRRVFVTFNFGVGFWLVSGSHVRVSRFQCVLVLVGQQLSGDWSHCDGGTHVYEPLTTVPM
jgi:hypothetical protein